MGEAEQVPRAQIGAPVVSGGELPDSSTGQQREEATNIASVLSVDQDTPPDAVPPSEGVAYGDAMTQAALKETRSLCAQAVRHFERGDRVQAASVLELAKGMMLPALAWLMHSSDIVLESEAQSSAEKDDPGAAEEPEASDMTGFYL